MLELHHPKFKFAGVDEAGCGALAGPVVASAVHFKYTDIAYFDKINDSKKLSKFKRNAIYDYLINDPGIDFSIVLVDEAEIDKINILEARLLAMRKALEKLSTPIKKVFVDGNRFHPIENMEHECIVKGDSKILSIAAASILAKVYRDNFMEKIHSEYPIYGWNKNKGYGTLSHREVIQEIGYSPYHRKSFKLKSTPYRQDH